MSKPEKIERGEILNMVRRYVEAGKHGTFACHNPHWYIHLRSDGIVYEYNDGDDVDDFDILGRYPTIEDFEKEDSDGFVVDSVWWWYEGDKND